MRRVLKIMTILIVVSLSLSAATKVDKKLKAQMLSAWKTEVKTSQSITKSITDKELIKWMEEDKEFILVDVREPKEVAAGHILAIEFKAIPSGMVLPAIGKKVALRPSQTIVFYCKLGSRSSFVARDVARVYGYKNVMYLKGGIMGWIKNGHQISNFMGEFIGVK
ncbi:MAG: rhodanese-like domain-containing protein [Sulfurospirillum sp.]